MLKVENPYYRNCLVHLEEHFHGKVMLTQKDVAQYLQIDPRTVSKRFDITKDGIHIAKLAQKLSKM